MGFQDRIWSQACVQILSSGFSPCVYSGFVRRKPSAEIVDCARSRFGSSSKRGCDIGSLILHFFGWCLWNGAFWGIFLRFPAHRPHEGTGESVHFWGLSGKSKVLVFFMVWSFNLHAPYILSADDLGDFSGILWQSLHFGGRRFLRSIL